jgi:putative transposase
MKQMIRSKLNTNLGDAAMLLRTMDRYNEMCNDIGPIAFQLGTSNIRIISDACYADMRDKYGLPSQMTVRAIARTAGVLTQDKTRIPRFEAFDDIVYDKKMLTFKHLDEASIMTTSGRISVPITVLGYQGIIKERPRGYSELKYRDHEFFLETFVETDTHTS